jgi:hypothetical protein
VSPVSGLLAFAAPTVAFVHYRVLHPLHAILNSAAFAVWPFIGSTSWTTTMLTVELGRSETEYFVLAGLQRMTCGWVGVSNDTSRYTQKHR